MGKKILILIFIFFTISVKGQLFIKGKSIFTCVCCSKYPSEQRGSTTSWIQHKIDSIIILKYNTYKNYLKFNSIYYYYDNHCYDELSKYNKNPVCVRIFYYLDFPFISKDTIDDFRYLLYICLDSVGNIIGKIELPKKNGNQKE